LAAEKASPALTAAFELVCDPPLGSRISTTVSQNIIRNKNRIACPRTHRGLMTLSGNPTNKR